MLPIISGGHSTYQATFISDFLAFYPHPSLLSKQTWTTIIEFWHLDLSSTDTFMQNYYSKFELFVPPKNEQKSTNSFLLLCFEIPVVESG